MEPVKTRTVRYISPTSYRKFWEDRTGYYLHYLAEKRPPREPQTVPMAIGSAFDARIKGHLYKELVKGDDPSMTFESLYKSQVEVQNQTPQLFADSQKCFDDYIKSGALADLLLEMGGSISTPKFETQLESQVSANIEGGMVSVPILGKPDTHFINRVNTKVILDYKVNGYYSNSGAYVKKGYAKKFPGGGSHKDSVVVEKLGVRVNTAFTLHEVDIDWGNQLTMYGWLAGVEVGEPFVVIIHQLAWKGGELTVGKHAYIVPSNIQWEIFKRCQTMWNAIQMNWIFDELPHATSIARCDMLDKVGDQVGTTNRAW